MRRDIMSFARTTLCWLLLSFLACGVAPANSGGGDVKIGYIFLDEEGNQAVDRSVFNEYEGLSVSLENFRYQLGNSHVLRADLKDIVLNNRNLSAELSRAGLYSLRASHNQFRRFYSSDGGAFTRRHQENVSLSVRPHRYVEVYGGGAQMGRSGTVTDLFSLTPAPTREAVDYRQTFYHGGARINYRGGMVQGEFRGNRFRDDKSPARDQDRKEGRVSGMLPVPRFERLTLSGGFRHFESRYKKTDFLLSSNRGWGSASLQLPADFSFRLFTSIDRTSSDSDYTATDNIIHATYVGYARAALGGATVGYQHDLTDQYEEQMQANSFYGSGWFRPTPDVELRAEYGNRAEDVKEGVRLVGDEERNKYRVSAKYRHGGDGYVRVKFDGRTRKNEEIGSKTSANRVTLDGSLRATKYGTLQGGYSYGNGKYENATETFDFVDHLVYGDVSSAEYRNLSLGFGATYYRSKQDLDVESFNLRFSASYRMFKDYRLEAAYNVHNFDDFTVRDEYYTANIVEISLTRGLSF